jgi:hypothetical protein
MANEFKVRKGLIVQGSGSNIFDVQGSQGQLFSITDSLSGSLFSVNDISGIPIMEVFSDNTIKLGTFNNEAIIVSGSRTGMGIATPQAKLHISGASNSGLFEIDSPAVNNIIYVSGSGRVGIGTNNPTNTLQVVGGVTATSFTGSLFGTSSWATNALTASNITPSITNNTDNRVLTATGGGTINGESNLTFDGIVLTVTGSARIRGSGVDTVGALIIQNSGGTATFTVLNGGTTGVGENNPSARLHVKGSGATSATTALRVENSSTAARLTILDDGTSAFNTNHLYVSSSGRVGIGTATPIAQLHVTNSMLVNGTSDYFGGIGTTVPIQMFAGVANNGIGFRTDNFYLYPYGNNTSLIYGWNGNAAWTLRNLNTSSFQIFNNSPTNAVMLTVSSSGNIGIGTATPVHNLVVDGNTGVSINAGGATFPNIHRDSADGGMLLRSWNGSTFTNNVKITPTTEVGIGTTTPTAELHISGASNITLLRVGSPAQSNILFITGSNRVGIGTGTPRALFEVNDKIIAEAGGNV